MAYKPYWVEDIEPVVLIHEWFYTQDILYRTCRWLPGQNVWPYMQDSVTAMMTHYLQAGYKIPFHFLEIASAVGTQMCLNNDAPKALMPLKPYQAQHLLDLIHRETRVREWFYEMRQLKRYYLWLEQPTYNSDDFAALTIWGRKGSKRREEAQVDLLPPGTDVVGFLKVNGYYVGRV